MIKIFLSLLFCFVCSVMSFAQNNEDFKPSGKVIMRGFFDYSTDFDKESGFDITRALLGYNYRITPYLRAQVVIDGAAGKTNDRFDVYIRNAFINWNKGGLNINAGLTGLLQFNLQEDYWMHRYVMQSFQDLNKMAPSVDMGVTGEYKFTDYLMADLSLTNGTGYKDVKKSGSKRYAAGITLHPINNIVLRAYADVFNESEDVRDELPEGVTDVNYKNQYSLSLFAGYRNSNVSGGVEYNKVYNKGFVAEKDYFGYSLYTSVKISPKFGIFARYDITDSNIPSSFTGSWNDDNQLIMGGVEFTPVKQLKISPNFRNINFDRSQSEQYLFVNVEFNL